jgi:predicted aconitase
VKLTEHDAKMLDGTYGEGVALAMSVLVAVGKAFDAEQMCDISRAHVALSNQDADIWFAERLVAGGAVCRVPPTVNPGFCLEFFRHVPGLSPEDLATMERTEAAYKALGAQLTYNCTPYLQGNVPRFGEVTAYSESSATPYMNSVYGARTNRESAQSALCAAVTARVPLYGLLLEENRRGQVLVHVEPTLTDEFDYHLLGYAVPRKTGIQTAFIPVFTGIPAQVRPEALMNLGAELNTGGNVPMYHIVGVTPEAPTLEAAFQGDPPGDAVVITQKDLVEQREMLTADSGQIEFALLGCPHLSLDQLKAIAERIDGRHFKVEFWVQTSFQAKQLAERMGIAAEIERAGGHLVPDTCIDQVVWKHLFGKKGVTDSLKGAYYSKRRGMDFVLCSVGDCVEAAIKGEA